MKLTDSLRVPFFHNETYSIFMTLEMSGDTQDFLRKAFFTIVR